MRRTFVSLAVLLLLFIAAIPFTALADTYPEIYLDVTATTHVIPQGETGDVTIIVYPVYPRERYTVQVFDSEGTSLAKVTKEYKNTSLEPKSFTLYIKSGEYDLPVGEYTIKYGLEYYTNSKWNACPENDPWTVYIVENVCNGDHMTALSLTLLEPTCTETGLGMYECKFCGYLECKDVPAAGHSYDDGVPKATPTTENDGVMLYTCTSCSATKEETIPALRIISQTGDLALAPDEIGYVTLEAEGSGLTYVWYTKYPASSEFKGSSSNRNYTGLSMNEERDGVQFYCVVSDEYGNSVTSDIVTFTMLHYAEIVTQPTDAVAQEGDAATVTFEAKGDGLTYEWYYKSVGMTKFMKTTAFTGNTYSVAMNESRDGRQLYCVVTDKYGNSVTTDTVTLIMGVPIVITAQPESITVPKGETATVRFTATGDDLSYAWYYKSVGMSRFIKTSAFTGNTYSVEMDGLRDGRQIYCLITDGNGLSVKTDTVTINMATPLEITLQPTGGTVYEGENAVVKVVAQGDGLTYQWYIANEGSSDFFKSSTTSAVYSVEMNASRDGRQLYCVITDAYGNTVKSDTVSICMAKPIKITQQPEDACVPAGKTASVKVTATGDGLRYAWYYKNADGDSFLKTNAFTGSTYAVTMNETRDGRQLYCVITDAYGTSVVTDTVTISIAQQLAITAQPNDYVTVFGQSYAVGFVAAGEGLTYMWYAAAPGSEEFVETGVTSSTYPYTMTEELDGTQLYCIVTDAFGNMATTDTATITGRYELKITEQPKSVSAPDGESVTVSFTATGKGLTYTWYYKSSGMTEFVKTTAFTGNRYSVVMNESRDGRQLYCVVSDEYGYYAVTDTVTISMADPTELAIMTQPESVTVAEGEYATVSFTAQGDGLTYEWYYKSAGMSKFYKTTAFTGNTYSVAMNESRNGRQLYCVVTDRYGNSVTTSTVTIGMQTPLKITSQPASVTVAEGATAKVSVSAQGDGLTYQWYIANEGSSKFIKSSTTTATYSVTMNESRDGRQLYCVVTDKYGNSVSSNTVSIFMK